ncbi:MAG: metal-dependent hydrolase [Moraxellaceae bacterium]|nr:metal-dependent hydrolase [Moraxellaceae bacterium]
MALANRAIGYDEVVTRDLHFTLTPDMVDRHWFNRDPWATHWMNAILVAVPDGERWVMHSARRQLDKLQDPKVHKAALEFIRQERIHAREHDAMNALAVAHGIRMDRLEQLFKRIRKGLQERLSDDMQSAVAAAFEHMTATISSVMLENPEVFDDTHPELAALLFWHFVEETEHKSVSFDVFCDASGGGVRGYLKRTGGMALATVIGFPLLVVNHAYLLYQDRQLTNLRSALYLADILLRRPGILSGVFLHYLPYYRPDFHPWDDDNRGVIRVWKQEFEKSGDVRLAYQALRQAKGRPDWRRPVLPAA